VDDLGLLGDLADAQTTEAIDSLKSYMACTSRPDLAPGRGRPSGSAAIASPPSLRLEEGIEMPLDRLPRSGCASSTGCRRSSAPPRAASSWRPARGVARVKERHAPVDGIVNAPAATGAPDHVHSRATW